MKTLRIIPVSLLALAAAGALALIVVVGSSILSGQQVSASTELPYVLRSGGGDSFGESVAVGDVDGDGMADIAVGAFTFSNYGDGKLNQGRAYVFSGADGSLLFPLDSPNGQSYGYFGASVAVGDVNGDGMADIAVGARMEDVDGHTRQGRAYVFSGTDGSLLLSLTTPNPQGSAYFGCSVAVSDVNGDGMADIAVGAKSEKGNGGPYDYHGRAYVFSGVDGSMLLTLDTPNPQGAASFGASLAVGDVDGDGMADIAVAAYREDVGDSEDQGRAYVFSGTDGSLLLTLDTPNPQTWARFGVSLAVGDIDSDGKGDITVGAYLEDVDGNEDQGRAYVFSGADGSLLFTLDTPNPQGGDWFGWSVAVGDVNGDGKADIALGSFSEEVGGYTHQGRAYVFSGADGSPLLILTTTTNRQSGAYFGWSVAVGDVDADGLGDIAAGHPPRAGRRRSMFLHPSTATATASPTPAITAPTPTTPTKPTPTTTASATPAMFHQQRPHLTPGRARSRWASTPRPPATQPLPWVR